MNKDLYNRLRFLRESRELKQMLSASNSFFPEDFLEDTLLDTPGDIWSQIAKSYTYPSSIISDSVTESDLEIWMHSQLSMTNITIECYVSFAHFLNLPWIKIVISDEKMWLKDLSKISMSFILISSDKRFFLCFDEEEYETLAFLLCLTGVK
jgi:hypothetical protein